MDPYEGESDGDEVLRAVADKNICKRPVPPTTMPEKIQAIMKDCLDDDPTVRPSFHELDMRFDRVPTRDFGATHGSVSSQEAALEDIFPTNIVEALKAGHQTDAEYHDLVTVYVIQILRQSYDQNETQIFCLLDLDQSSCRRGTEYCFVAIA